MQQKLNLTRVICLLIAKTIEAKPHRVNLMSPLLRIHYYQNKWLQVKEFQYFILTKQAVASKGIPILYTNLQLNPYPSIQLDL